jgi:porin
MTPQDVMSGGRSTGSGWWNNVDYTLNVDTHKLGLWPSGFFKFEADTSFGSTVLNDSGAIVPVNIAALIPGINDRTSALMNATFAQFLSEQFGIFLGKINTFDSIATEFYGDYRIQFLNTAFNFPLTVQQIPISTFGGRVIGIPREDILLSAQVVGPNGSPTSNSVSQAFNGSAMVLGGGGRHQAVRAHRISIHECRVERPATVFAHPEPVRHRRVAAAEFISAAAQSRTGPRGHPLAVLSGAARPQPAR